MKNHQSYNVVLLPPQNITKQAVSLSKGISKSYKTCFNLDPDGKIPHVTLYQIEIHKKISNT